MKLRNYCLVVLMGMLWSTGAMAGTVNINLAEVGELAKIFTESDPASPRRL